MSTARIIRLAIATLAISVMLPTCGGFAVGADQEFVGILALVVEDDVATKLGLSKSLRRQLLELIDDREAEALELALRLRDLSAGDRENELGPFRKASEQLGLKLLTASQRQALKDLHISRMGMISLGEAKVAKRLKLSPEQEAEIAEILKRRVTLSERDLDKNDRELRAVLNERQLVSWRAFGDPQFDANEIANSKGLKATTTVDQPSASKSEEAPALSTNKGDSLRFSFRYAPWANVIEWFANESGLSLLMDAPPQGTFNYSDPREYTAAQAIDLLNSVLLTKGFTLVRRGKMLMVVNLEDGIPPNLITEVAVEDLDAMGEYELVKCLFTLRGLNADEAAEEISRLVGPQGKVNVLSSSNQLQITETAGRLRTFRKILEAGERKGDAALGSAKLIRMRHIRAKDVLEAWRKLMGLTDEDNVSMDGSTRLAQGKTSRQLLVSGAEYRVAEIEELVALLDVPPGSGLVDTPQLQVYPIVEADPESVLAVMQELFDNSEEIRLAIDPSTGSLVALATLEEHATISATVKQLQADKRQVEVIRLRTVDPQLAMLSIEKLFGMGTSGEDEATTSPNVPRVDADPISRSLLIRASAAQIEDIRKLLVKMGELDPSSDDGDRSLGSGRGNLRMIPIDAATARRALEQMNSIWPTVRKNPIRTVRPSRRIRGEASPGREQDHQEDSSTPTSSLDSEPRSVDGMAPTTSRFVVQLGPRNDENNKESDTAESRTTSEELTNLPDVVVTIGDQGLLIASEDTEALDEFEELFMTLADRLFTGSREMAIFYLKYAKSDVASEMLKQFIGGGSSSSSNGGGGSTLLGTLAGAALGNSGIGSMLGLGGASSGGSARISSGTTILSDPRLNAVIVQATPKELDFIEDLLQLLDKSNSPERIETIPRPRAIPVLNTDAETVAEVVRSVYTTRLAGGSVARNRQPSPEEFMRAISGQKNTSKTINNAIQDQVQVNISVDKRRNALLVVAPDPLFEEIKTLVADLDFATPELSEVVRYGRAQGSSPEMIRSAIATIMMNEADAPSKAKETATSKDSSNKDGQRQNPPGMEEMKRRMEFFKAIQNRAAKERAAAKKAASKAGK